MTTQELTDYYANLLILQYQGKPKAFGHMQALCGISIMDQLPLLVRDAFNIENAVGVQLEIIGKYAGVVRTYGTITLSDSDFRSIIKIAIIKNCALSDLYSIQVVINTFFPSKIFVFDYKAMRMGFYLDSSIGGFNFAKLCVTQDLLPFPMGVTRSSTIYAANLSNLFGFRTYELPAYNVKPFNTYTVYDSSSPWLDYSYAVI